MLRLYRFALHVAGFALGGIALPVTMARAQHPLNAYVGTFADSLFGEVTVTEKDDKLMAVRGGLHGPMEHVNRDNFTWSTGLTVLPSLPVAFLIGPDGRANALLISFSGESWRLGRKASR